MEHVVQFGINIDDALIKKTVVDTAVRTIMDNIQHDVEAEIFMSGWTNRKEALSAFSANVLGDVFEKYKAEIIECAADKLARSIRNTKMYKEAMSEVLSDGGENTGC